MHNTTLHMFENHTATHTRNAIWVIRNVNHYLLFIIIKTTLNTLDIIQTKEQFFNQSNNPFIWYNEYPKNGMCNHFESIKFNVLQLIYLRIPCL
jgi:hypothetical protein